MKKLIVLLIVLVASLSINVVQFNSRKSWESFAHQQESLAQTKDSSLQTANSRLLRAEDTIITTQGDLLHNRVDQGLNLLLTYKYQGQVN